MYIVCICAVYVMYTAYGRIRTYEVMYGGLYTAHTGSYSIHAIYMIIYMHIHTLDKKGPRI